MVLSQPPTVSVLRVNNLKFSTTKAEKVLQSHLNRYVTYLYSIDEVDFVTHETMEKFRS